MSEIGPFPTQSEQARLRIHQRIMNAVDVIAIHGMLTHSKWELLSKSVMEALMAYDDWRNEVVEANYRMAIERVRTEPTRPRVFHGSTPEPMDDRDGDPGVEP